MLFGINCHAVISKFSRISLAYQLVKLFLTIITHAVLVTTYTFRIICKQCCFCLSKVRVVDVVSKDSCVCETEEGRLLEGGLITFLSLSFSL